MDSFHANSVYPNWYAYNFLVEKEYFNGIEEHYMPSIFLWSYGPQECKKNEPQGVNRDAATLQDVNQIQHRSTKPKNRMLVDRLNTWIRFNTSNPKAVR